MPRDVSLTITRTASDILGAVLTLLHPYRWYMLETAVFCAAAWIFHQWIPTSRQQLRTTQIQGPPSESFLYGVGKHTLDDQDSDTVYEVWAKEYGDVYVIPLSLGSKRVVLCDPKAIAHFFSKDTRTYVQATVTKRIVAFFGRSVIWVDGEDHRKQRRPLNRAFSAATVRQLMPIFYDAAYKTKSAWDSLIESSNCGSALIEIEGWMNRISLDSMGLAGFSHNFGAVEGKNSSVTEAFDAFNTSPGGSVLNKGLFLLAQVFPLLVWVPTPRAWLVRKLAIALSDFSNVLLAQTWKDMEMGVTGSKEEGSIVGQLVRPASGKSAVHLNKEEVMAQIPVLLLGGYETTSISLAWALVELSRNPDIQTILRNELIAYGKEPTYDQLVCDLPYLDAVVHEILRLHLPTIDAVREAAEDDVIPLSKPIRTKTGEQVNSLTIAKGTQIFIPLKSINRSAAIWGDDAKIFRPSRWFEGVPAKAKEVQGYRHLLTFADGPRVCLGRTFAVAEFKVVLMVLVKNFVFELRDGVDSKIEIGRGVMTRPKMAGEVGCKLPLRVRPYDA